MREASQAQQQQRPEKPPQTKQHRSQPPSSQRKIKVKKKLAQTRSDSIGDQSDEGLAASVRDNDDDGTRACVNSCDPSHFPTH